MGDFKGALTDLHHYAKLPIASPFRDFGLLAPDDAELKLWIIQAKLGKKAQANAELAAYLDERTGPPSTYNQNGRSIYTASFANIANYLLDRISADEFRKSNAYDQLYSNYATAKQQLTESKK